MLPFFLCCSQKIPCDPLVLITSDPSYHRDAYFIYYFMHLSSCSPLNINEESTKEYFTISCAQVSAEIHFWWNSSRWVAWRKEVLIKPLSTVVKEGLFYYVLDGLTMFRHKNPRAHDTHPRIPTLEHRQTNMDALKMSPLSWELIVVNFF